MAIKPADAVFVFTSGDYRGLRYLQAKHPGVDLLLITSKPCCDETIDLCKAMGITRMGATMDGTSRKAVKKAHKEGLIVSLWPRAVGRGLHARRLPGLRLHVHRRADCGQELSGREGTVDQGEVLTATDKPTGGTSERGPARRRTGTLPPYRARCAVIVRSTRSRICCGAMRMQR